MIYDEIQACCKKLKLSRNLADNSMNIKAENNSEYLLRILQEEIQYRQKARQEKLIKAAGFYNRKSFAGYQYDEINLPAQLAKEDLEEVKFIEEKKNLLFYGNVGTGKTHLATAIGIAACRKEKKVGFYRTAHLVQKLSEAKAKRTLLKFEEKLMKLDLLICDEWGYVPLDRDGSRELFQVISDSYEQKSIILTTNLEFSRWISIFYDEQLTAALIDRLVHHSYLLIFNGESKRIRDSVGDKIN